MAGLASDFVADRVADAAIDGFIQMGVAKGATAALATTVGAGLLTIVAMATPLVLVAGAIYVAGGFDPPKPNKTG